MLSQGPIEDRLQIRELIDSYNNAVMRFDGETWASNWLRTGFGICLVRVTCPVGRSTQWQVLLCLFCCCPASPILVDGDTAKGTWYQQEFLYQKDGLKRSVTGRYEDDYVKRDGRWFFREAYL